MTKLMISSTNNNYTLPNKDIKVINQRPTKHKGEKKESITNSNTKPSQDITIIKSKKRMNKYSNNTVTKNIKVQKYYHQ